MITDEESKSTREQRFITPNICSRNVWVNKLLHAKNKSFGANDCIRVPVEDMML